MTTLVRLKELAAMEWLCEESVDEVLDAFPK
jgi:hypothetical protein